MHSVYSQCHPIALLSMISVVCVSLIILNIFLAIPMTTLIPSYIGPYISLRHLKLY